MLRGFRDRLHRRGLLPAVLLTAGMLSGCGPASLRSHLPPVPQVYLFQNTSPVQSSPGALALAANQLPAGLQLLNTQAADNASLARISSDPTATTQQYSHWHRLDGTLLNYEIPSQQALSPSTRVQVDIGRYATLADARGMFQGLVTSSATNKLLRRLPDPGIGPTSAAFRVTLSTISGELVYFQQRNLVLRIVTVGPATSPAMQIATDVAKREYSRIASAN